MRTGIVRRTEQFIENRRRIERAFRISSPQTHCLCALLLGLDDRDRMNVPGVSEGNWSWRATEEQLVASQDRLRKLAEESGRLV